MTSMGVGFWNESLMIETVIVMRTNEMSSCTFCSIGTNSGFSYCCTLFTNVLLCSELFSTFLELLFNAFRESDLNNSSFPAEISKYFHLKA